VTIFAAVIAFQQRDWRIIGVMPFGWLFLVLTIYVGTRYRIFWRDGAVIQNASGMPEVSINANEITRVALETSDTQTLLSLRRPFRRIAIYASSPNQSKMIDVSLKHFAPHDIRRLMQAIHDRRPDLSIPKNWI